MQEEQPKAPDLRLDGFRERAIREAQRYGQDPWIFVRELLQNARDAGATRVQFIYKESDHKSELHCIDNGEGMGWEHAQRYLFSLYTSSKEDQKNKAGRFGVGFWSILRFFPESIIIRSKPRGEPSSPGWGLNIDGQLRDAKTSSSAKQSGTEIILSRPSNNAHQAQQLLEAVRDHGRFLTQRDEPTRKLEILVNGVCINAPFELPEPSISFSRKGIRGVVGLAPHGKVELFSRGLRVRCAATLDDLISSRAPRHSPAQIRGVAPQILLDCDHIQVLLHRSDVRENTELKRAMSLTRSYLRRLVQAQLSGVRPPGGLELLICAKTRFLERSRVFRWVSASTLISCTGLGIWSFSASQVPSTHPRPLSLGAFRQTYRGPTVQSGDGEPQARLNFRYTPASLRPHFRQFSISDFKSMRPTTEPELTAYQGATCKHDCISIEMEIDGDDAIALSDGYAMNLIEATGHRIDPKSLSLDLGQGQHSGSTTLLQDQHGDPWLSSKQPLSGTIKYSLAPAKSPQDPQSRLRITDATFLAWRPQDSLLPGQAQAFVAKQVQYALDPITATAHQEAIERDQNVFARGIQIGAGDCDVQNSLLAALLRDQGYQSRLALGYVGQQGQLPVVAHAWTEYRQNTDEPWAILDASRIVRAQGPSLLAQGNHPPNQIRPHAKSPRSSDTKAPSSFGWWWVSFGLCLTGLGIFLFRSQKAPEGSIDKSQQKLVDLLLSALEHPSSFSYIPGVFRRPVVSTLGSRPISLATIKRAQRYGRLWSSSHKHPIAKRAIACNDHLLDHHCPVAKAVSIQLQVEDLDLWQRKWESRDSGNPQIDSINRTFLYLGLSAMIITGEFASERPEHILFGPRPLLPEHPRARKLQITARCLVFYASKDERISALEGPDPLWARYCLVQDLLHRVAVDESLARVVRGYFAKQTCKELVA